MAYLLERLPSGSRIAVIRLRSLGDCVLTTPALALLKSHRPDLRIGVVVEDRFRAVFEGNPDVDEILPAAKLGRARSGIPGWRLNLHGGTRSMWLTAASGAEINAGFAHHAYSFLYSAKIPRAQEILGEERPVHTAEHLASAMFWMGVPRTEIPRARLTCEPDAFRWRVRRVSSLRVARPRRPGRPSAFSPSPSICRIKPDWSRCSWPDPPTMSAAFAQFHGASQRARSAQVKSLIAGAQLFVGNDSGPAHIAAAFGVPVVVLFGPSDPVTWAPWRTEAQVLTSPELDRRHHASSEVIAAAEAVKGARMSELGRLLQYSRPLHRPPAAFRGSDGVRGRRAGADGRC